MAVWFFLFKSLRQTAIYISKSFLLCTTNSFVLFWPFVWFLWLRLKIFSLFHCRLSITDLSSPVPSLKITQQKERKRREKHGKCWMTWDIGRGTMVGWWFSCTSIDGESVIGLFWMSSYMFRNWSSEWNWQYQSRPNEYDRRANLTDKYSSSRPLILIC